MHFHKIKCVIRRQLVRKEIVIDEDVSVIPRPIDADTNQWKDKTEPWIIKEEAPDCSSVGDTDSDNSDSTPLSEKCPVRIRGRKAKDGTHGQFLCKTCGKDLIS